MRLDRSGCAKVAKQLPALAKQKATGKLILDRPEQAMASADLRFVSDEDSPAPSQWHRHWEFYFCQGRLLYAVSDPHRVRRWSRALRQHAPDFVASPTPLPVEEPWEYELLDRGVSSGHLSPTQAKAIIRTTAQEVFLDLASQTGASIKWEAAPQSDPQEGVTMLLSSMDVAQIVEKSLQMWQQWQEMGLDYIYPDQAPVLSDAKHLKTQISSQSFLTINTLFNGENTLWDIALQRKQSVLGVTRTLHHFIKQGKISLKDVADWPSPIEHMQMVMSAVNPYKPLIACIDDSRIVGEKLEQILVPAGYRVLKLQDPMQGVAALAEHKPDLIFLDVVMPQTNGYNLCSFLRQSVLFRDTPIIILTSRDGLIDRTRAKINGASDFLSKPPEAHQVEEIVAKYLHHSTSKNYPLDSPAIA
ncbi:MAG TPA: response regulator [Oscillatoriaceae cyanobacterium M33_DOE_052]|uniref:Protein PatA n=1 Tax=Planktothricoides sp. SpSt-374 TaxID=2282167 RepID=A0A7C3ZHG9_9CYAN|nr:response regulator [Oscillatoriaceae cyanobacterium M33_DOE_052]